EQASAGIALQAYIPDSARVQRELNEWARRRVAAGGAPITIRIVKGANMEAERVEASLRDWPHAPFKSKRETDANYKRMLREAMAPENLAAVRVGIGSHNLLLYAPACRREEFLNAIGYLIPRLDENTGPENFLRHAFKLKVGSPDWEQ